MYFSFVTASTVGYGDVTPVTPAGKILTGILIFVGIGLLGFASAQLTTRLLPQRNELSELRAALDHQTRLLEDLTARIETLLPTTPKSDARSAHVDEFALELEGL